jgi:glycosyltransferase involved in cell wall biosynthesis
LVALFGDNKDFWNWSSVKHSLKSVKSIVLQKSIKNRLYAKAVESCDKLVLYTPETENIMLSYMPEKLKKELREKAILSTLGFDPDEFFFDEKDRENLRKAFGASKSEVVLITSTRVNRRKNIENVIDIISKLYIEGNKVRYIIIGFLGDNYEKEIKAYINKKPNPEIFHCYPFISHKEIRKLYCASDIGIWLKAAISIQEAMGTGLPVILENKLSVNHLIQEGINGWFFEKGKLVDIIKKAVSNMSNKSYEERIVQRKSIEKYNYERLSYDKIAQKIIDGIS